MAPSTLQTSSESFPKPTADLISKILPKTTNGTHQNLILRPATIPERHCTWAINNTSWRGPLTQNAYYLREAHLSTQDLTRNGGITYWILTDPSEETKPNEPTILSACETIRKEAVIVRRDGTVEKVVAHGIGSVYTDEKYRGKGYAGRMLRLLAHRLKGLGHEELRCGFSVLYSDIGKEFYAKIGWKPHPSSHISFPSSLPALSQPLLPTTQLLSKSQLKYLCDIDCEYIIKTFTKLPFSSSTQARAIQLPTIQIMDWHHAREEFVGQYTVGKTPSVKGAWVPLNPSSTKSLEETDASEAVWTIWTHDFTGGKLLLLRFHVPSITSSNSSQILEAIKQVVIAAAEEASLWNFREIQSWNPDDITVEAVESIFGKTDFSSGGYDVVHREMDSIASLMWYDREDGHEEIEPEGIEWCVNEKFAWC